MSAADVLYFKNSANYMAETAAFLRAPGTATGL